MRDTEFLYKIFWLSTIIITTINSSKTIPKLFVLLIDGLRYDSVQNETLSGFSSLKNRGVSAHHLEPNFPSTGYPNYYTLLTGLYPEQHGITDDFMYDYNKQAYFIKGTGYDSNGSTIQWPVDGEPFWNTASNQGKNVSMYWWPGCTGTNGTIPSEHCQDFGQQSLNNAEHAINLVLDQFQRGLMDVSFMHIDEVDFYGHGDGPHGYPYGEAVGKVDLVLQHLENQLNEKNMTDSVNVIVLSVYGFRSMIRPTTIIELSNFLPEINSSLSFVEGGSHVPLYPPKERIISTFNKLYGRHRHLKVYWKYNTPEHWRVRNGPYVAPIWMVADPGWVLAVSPKEALIHEKNRGGYNGYDPDVSEDMWGAFIAAGPNIYNLLCFASGLAPSKNEGDMKFVKEMTQQDLDTSAGMHGSTFVETENVTDNMSVSQELVNELKTTPEATTVVIEIGTTTEDTSNENETSGNGDDDTSGDSSGSDSFNVHPSQQPVGSMDSSGSGEEPIETHMDIEVTMKETDGDIVEDDEDSGSGERDSSGNTELLDQPVTSGRFETGNLLSNENRRLIRKTVEDFKKIFINDILDEEGLMEFSPKARKFNHVQQKEPPAPFHLSVVVERQTNAERVPKGVSNEIHIKFPRRHDEMSSNRKVALVNIDQHNVQSNGKMTKFNMHKPQISMNFN